MAKKSDENLMAALSYLLGFITGIIFLLIEKKSKFVRFHAMQSTITFLTLTVIQWLLGFSFFMAPATAIIALPFAWLIGLVISILGFIFWILGMIKAYQGEKYKFPVFGDLAEKYA